MCMVVSIGGYVTDATNVLLLCLIPALVILLLAYTVNRSASKRATQAMAEIHRDEAWMGRFVRDHKPRVTVHSLVNKMFKPRRIISHFAVTKRIFPDISFYQGVVNFDVMREKTDKVIIRAGQNLWTDIQFKRNWAEAKRVGMKRGAYFFYDDRIDPGRQADLLISLLRDDLPELGIWADYEHSYGGSFGGLKNVIAFMDKVELALWIDVGIYTGYYFWRENTNPVSNASHYKYIKEMEVPLWEAWYGESPLVPAPWVDMKYHQFGTPAVGIEWGVETKEIDLNEDMSGDPAPQPEPPKEETMKGTVKAGYRLKIRNADGDDTGKVIDGGDVVYGEVASRRIYFQRIYDIGGVIDLHTIHNSAIGDGVTEWITLTNEAEPAPPPVPDGLRFVVTKILSEIEILDTTTGKRYGATVTDAPNVQFVEL